MSIVDVTSLDNGWNGWSFGHLDNLAVLAG